MDLCKKAELSLQVVVRIQANRAERQELFKSYELKRKSLELEAEQLTQELNAIHGVVPKQNRMLVGVKTVTHAGRKGSARPARERRTPEETEKSIERLLSEHPSGLTANVIQNRLHLHHRYCAPAIRNLLKRGAIRKVTVKVTVPLGSRSRQYQFQGYALALQEVKEKAS